MYQTDAQRQTQQRVEKALGWHDPTEQQRDAVVTGVVAAGGLGFFTWDELGAEARHVIEQLEQTQQTGWSDPDDVPENTPADF